MELTWSKVKAGEYMATNKSGQTAATARKDGRVWHVEVANDNSVRQVGTYKLARTVVARVLEDQRWEQIRAENLTEGDTLRFVDGEGTVTGVEPVGNNLSQVRVSYVMGNGKRYSATFYPGSRFERLRKPEPVVRYVDVQGAQELAEWEADDPREMLNGSLLAYSPDPGHSVPRHRGTGRNGYDSALRGHRLAVDDGRL
ncbi:hypothetical protein ACFY0G_09320 [Streptomyces sp. NPDC001552]|uniref:hypothetical protein n=1 Tax=Streptomyces sp. NPDC001552 TaxID=3364587 RepID=UPI0036845436